MATVRRKAVKTEVPAPLPGAPLDALSRDAEGRTALHTAAFHGYIETVRHLLQQQAEVDARDEQQRTPGHWSAFKGHLAVVKTLVEHGADVNARDTEGRTWLKMAVIGQQSEMEHYIRERGGVL